MTLTVKRASERLAICRFAYGIPRDAAGIDIVRQHYGFSFIGIAVINACCECLKLSKSFDLQIRFVIGKRRAGRHHAQAHYHGEHEQP